jgi:LacI family transcriptional regulator, galactose operon repressor
MPRAPLPRLKDVAKEANVSLSAASRILRGQGERYAAETRQRVMSASSKLGWRQNLLVSGMQTGETRTIGVMIPPFDSYWVGVLDGIHTTLSRSDYLPITVWPRGWRELGVFESQKEEGFELISRLLDRRVDGLILWPTYAVAYREHFRELTERAVPVGVIDHTISTGGLTDVVETDDRRGAATVAQYLMKKGHRRIACLSTREIEAQTWAVRRREAFEASCERRKRVECRSWRTNAAGDNALEVAIDLLSSDFEPTAVFCVSDHEAKLIYLAASELKLSIPDDISVIGFNDLDFAAMLQPSLTTMHLDGEQMGRIVAEMILGRLGDEETKPNTAKVKAELVERESVAMLRDGS